MSERMLLIECRSIVREFLQTLKEKQRLEMLEDEGNSVDSSSDFIATNGDDEYDEKVPLSDSSVDREEEGQLAETMLTKSSRNKFVWTKRAVRIVMRRYGR